MSSGYIVRLAPYIFSLSGYIVRLAPYIFSVSGYIVRLAPYIFSVSGHIVRLAPHIFSIAPYIFSVSGYIYFLINIIILKCYCYATDCKRQGMPCLYPFRCSRFISLPSYPKKILRYAFSLSPLLRRGRGRLTNR